jgi:hypothetical protein
VSRELSIDLSHSPHTVITVVGEVGLDSAPKLGAGLVEL